jgi:hypothetical protein
MRSAASKMPEVLHARNRSQNQNAGQIARRLSITNAVAA